MDTTLERGWHYAECYVALHGEWKAVNHLSRISNRAIREGFRFYLETKGII